MARLAGIVAQIGQWSDGTIALIILGMVFGVYVLCPIRTPFDSRWTIHTAVSLIYSGDSNLDEYEEYIRSEDYYAIERRDGHMYNRYPIGPSLVALPHIIALDTLAHFISIPKSSEIIKRRWTPLLEVVIASSLVAAAAALMYLVGRTCDLTNGASSVLAIVFAFATSAWSIGSRALWQHGPSMLMLAAGLYCLLRARRGAPVAFLAAIPLAFSLIIRPTNGLALGILSAYVVWKHPRQSLEYLALVALVLGPFIAFNIAGYGQWFSPYYFPSGQPQGALTDIPWVMAGHLISPSRGLFVVSPILLFSLWGMAEMCHERDLLDVAILTIIAAHLLVISTAGQWWAGHSFGARFLADLTPFLVYCLVPVLRRLRVRPVGYGEKAFHLTFALTLAWSIFAHSRAATTWDVWAWNSDPVSVDLQTTRVWDWSDVQMLRGLLKR